MTDTLVFISDYRWPILCGLIVALALTDLVVQHIRWKR